MFYQFCNYLRGKLAFFLAMGFALALPTPASAQSAEKKSDATQLRIFCVASLVEDQEIILASRDKSGVWQEHSTVKLRSPFVSEWLPAKAGDLHLALRSATGLTSICQFTYPADAQRVLVVLLPDSEKEIYRADVINPAKLKFAKGSILLANYGRTTATVMLGARRAIVKSGERAVVKAAPEANGMFRMLVAYTGKADELIPCYDRYIPNNDDTRDLVLLLPDPVLGLRVFSFPEFGPYD